MIQMGDEIGRSQGGNNNAFCQDTEISWMKWTDRPDRDWKLLEFVRGLSELRREYAVLGCRRFLHGEPVAPDIANVTWVKPDGEEKRPEHWEDPVAKCVGLCLADSDHLMLLIFNSDGEQIDFTMPSFGGQKFTWRVLCDTATGEIRPDRPLLTDTISVPARSLLLLERASK